MRDWPGSRSAHMGRGVAMVAMAVSGAAALCRPVLRGSGPQRLQNEVHGSCADQGFTAVSLCSSTS